MLEIRTALKNLFFGSQSNNLKSGEVGEDVVLSGYPRYCNPDSLVDRKGLDIYKDMRKDAQIKACLAIKTASVLSRGWEVLPVRSDGERGRNVAAFCTYALEQIKGSILTVLSNICDAISMGYSIQNVTWEPVQSGKWAGYLVPSIIKSKNPTDWSFDCDPFYNVTGIRYLPDDTVYPPNQFIVYSYNSIYANPYGESDLRACYKNWWSKDVLTRFWNLYLEKYGSPTIKGKYRRGTPKAIQEELLKTLGRIQQQSAFVIPEDMEAELLETIRQGDVGYRIAVEYHNKEIAKSILNMTLITDEGSSGVGSFALAKVHLDILRMCLKRLKLELEETIMKEQVLLPMVRYNFGVDVPIPSFSLGAMDDRDFNATSKSICDLVTAGILSPEDPFIRDYLGLQDAGPAPKRPELPTVKRSRNADTGNPNGNDAEVKVGA